MNYAKLEKLYEAMKPSEEFSPAEKEVYWDYIVFLFDYCAPEFRALINDNNLDVIFPTPEEVYATFCKANGGKSRHELVKELEGGAGL